MSQRIRRVLQERFDDPMSAKHDLNANSLIESTNSIVQNSMAQSGEFL